MTLGNTLWEITGKPSRNEIIFCPRCGMGIGALSFTYSLKAISTEEIRTQAKDTIPKYWHYCPQCGMKMDNSGEDETHDGK